MNDETIVELFWNRSEQAIEETERAYGRYCHYIAHNILRDEEEAKEIVNDTYFKVWNTIPPERPQPLKGFLGRVTRQLALNRLERNTAKKRRGGQYDLALDELAECLSSKDDGDVADEIALTDCLNRFLHSLPDERRRVFIRRYWYMSSIADIASAYGMSESKVASMLLRLRKKLKQTLIEEGFDP